MAGTLFCGLLSSLSQLSAVSTELLRVEELLFDILLNLNLKGATLTDFLTDVLASYDQIIPTDAYSKCGFIQVSLLTGVCYFSMALMKDYEVLLISCECQSGVFKNDCAEVSSSLF